MRAIDKLKRAKTQLVLNHPFFGYITLLLKMKENKNIDTIGVNKNFDMAYNPEFIESLSDEEVEGVVLHEVLHLALAHEFRSKGKDRIISNVAQDIIINNIITKAGFKLPKGLVPENDSIEILIFGKPIRITNISQKSFEMIYDEIIKQIDDIVITLVVVSDGGSEQNDSNEENEGMGDNSDNQNDNEQTDGSGGGETESNDENEDGQQNKSGYDKRKEIKERILEELSKRVLDDHSDLDDLNEDERKELAEKIKQILIEAYEHNKKMKGNIPSELLRLIEDLTEPKLSWKQILYLFVANNLPSRYTYSRPSKRSYTLDVYLPKLLKEDVNMIICVDTSGSISNDELREFFSEMVGIINSFDNIHAKVIFADCKIHEVVDFDRNTDIEELISKCKGGGGTSHIPVFEYIENNYPNTRLIVCFTDGYTDVPNSINISAKVLWVLTEDGSDKEVKKIGEVIWLK